MVLGEEVGGPGGRGRWSWGAGRWSADQQVSALVRVLLHELLYVPTGNASSQLLLLQEVHGSLRRSTTTIKDQSSGTSLTGSGSGYLGQQRRHSSAPEGLRHEGGGEIHLTVPCEPVEQHRAVRRSCGAQSRITPDPSWIPESTNT